MALKANPNMLECLYTPLVEHATPLAQELLRDARALSVVKMVYQTYNGYVMSQFKKLEQDLRNRGEVKWKHAMHLMRLLLSGISALREGNCACGSKNIEMPFSASNAANSPGPNSTPGVSNCTRSSTPHSPRRNCPNVPIMTGPMHF